MCRQLDHSQNVSMLNRITLNPNLPTRFVLAALGIAFLNFVFTLMPQNVFVHADYFRYILQETTRDGLGFQWLDLVNSFQLRSPGEFRPRFLAYGIGAIDQKIRLVLYDYILVHPTFAPLAWFLQLFVGPALLLLFIRNLTGSLLAGIASVAIYMTSVGFLSGFTMGLLQGKALSNVVYIAALYFASRVQLKARQGEFLYQVRGFDKYLLLGFLFLGMFIDELPLFAFVLVPALFLGLFIDLRNVWSQVKRTVLNAGFFSLPFLLFLVFVILIAPLITQKYFNFYFDYLGNLLAMGENKRGAHSIFSGPYATLSASLVLENFTNLFGISLASKELSPLVKGAHGDYFSSQSQNFFQLIILGAFFSVAVLLVFKRKLTYSIAFRGMLIAVPFFMVFLTLLQIRHIPVATGYYYGCTFAVIFSILAGFIFNASSQIGQRCRFYAGVAVLLIVLVQIDNFFAINRGWIKTHNEDMTRNSFSSVLSLGPPASLRTSDLRPIWKAWRQGQMQDYLQSTPIPAGAVYLVYELRTIDKFRGVGPEKKNPE